MALGLEIATVSQQRQINEVVRTALEQLAAR